MWDWRLRLDPKIQARYDKQSDRISCITLTENGKYRRTSVHWLYDECRQKCQSWTEIIRRIVVLLTEARKSGQDKLVCVENINTYWKNLRMWGCSSGIFKWIYPVNSYSLRCEITGLRRALSYRKTLELKNHQKKRCKKRKHSWTNNVT